MNATNIVAYAHKDDVTVGSSFLNSTFSIMPSGKHYTPWCSNQTEEDMIQDSQFNDVLEEVASEHGGWIELGEGDPCDMFFVMEIEEEVSND